MLFYKTFILSVLTFNFMNWYANLNVQCKNKLQKIVKIAGKVIGKDTGSLEKIYEERVLKKVTKIMKDSKHLLYSEYNYLPSGRRLRSAKAKTARNSKSFVCNSIRLYNKHK